MHQIYNQSDRKIAIIKDEKNTTLKSTTYKDKKIHKVSETTNNKQCNLQEFVDRFHVKVGARIGGSDKTRRSEIIRVRCNFSTVVSTPYERTFHNIFAIKLLHPLNMDQFI